MAPSVTPRPPLWLVMPVAAGNLSQLIGIIIGAWFFNLAAVVMSPTSARMALMIVGWLLIYLYSHAIAHWAMGRLVGIQFRGYGLRGTDHPEAYPPGIRRLMSIIPFFVALTEKSSMRHASATAKALMFGAGETATTVCTLIAARYAWQTGTPGGRALFVFSVLWNLGATIVTSIVPTGDYAKARRALRSASPT